MQFIYWKDDSGRFAIMRKTSTGVYKKFMHFDLEVAENIVQQIVALFNAEVAPEA